MRKLAALGSLLGFTLTLGLVACGGDDATSAASDGGATNEGGGSGSDGGATNEGGGSGSDGGAPVTGGNEGKTPASPAVCQERCETTVKQCGLDAAAAKARCEPYCTTETVTYDQLYCFDSTPCSAVVEKRSIISTCGEDSSSTGNGLGSACTCAGKGPDSRGTCVGADNGCKSYLSCVYDRGSSGKGTCTGKECCDEDVDCGANPALMKSCNGLGTCKKATDGRNEWVCNP